MPGLMMNAVCNGMGYTWANDECSVWVTPGLMMNAVCNGMSYAWAHDECSV